MKLTNSSARNVFGHQYYVSYLFIEITQIDEIRNRSGFQILKPKIHHL